LHALISLSHKNRPWFFLLLVLTALVLMVMLYFGIRLEGVRPSNNVQWPASGFGLTFEASSQAYTESFFTGSGSASSIGLTIELAVQPRYFSKSNIGMLMMVHDGDADSQLVICQWRSSLIVMNGNDYSNRRRIPKIYFALDPNRTKPHFITIVSNNSGTRIFLDGVLKKSNKDLILRYPNETAQARLVVANSVAGRAPWAGTMTGLAFYDHGLENDVIARHFEMWRMKPNFSAFKPHGPRLLYAFDEGQGEKISNKLGDGLDLIVPAWIKVLQPEAFSWPQWEDLGTPNRMKDMWVNFTGFIPLGFLLIATLSRLEGFRGRRALLTALIGSFLFSFGIETAQVWIPYRHSSMLDLILNTLGGGFGALLFQMIRIPSRKL
jgi:VanZ family protein